MRYVDCPFEFEQEDWANDIIVPKSQTVKPIKNSPFLKAYNFGFTIPLSFPLWLKGDKAIFRISGIDTVIEAKGGNYLIPLGFKIFFNKEYAIYNVHEIDRNSIDYIVDKDSHKDCVYTPKLLLKQRMRGSFPEGIPAIKIIPLLDFNYNFVYRRRENERTS